MITVIWQLIPTKKIRYLSTVAMLKQMLKQEEIAAMVNDLTGEKPGQRLIYPAHTRLFANHGVRNEL